MPEKGRDVLRVGAQIMKYVIISTRTCYRSVYNHPFLVGILLLVFYLYRSAPFLFSLLVSASPVLVCTAVLLGTLLSFGEQSVPFVEEDEERSSEFVELEKDLVENSAVIERDGEGFDRGFSFPELRGEIVEKDVDELPLVENVDRLSKFELEEDVHNWVPDEQVSRELVVEKEQIGEARGEVEDLEIEHKDNSEDQITGEGVEDLEIEQKVDFEYQRIGETVEVGLVDEKVLEDGLLRKVEGENVEEYSSAEGSVEVQTRDGPEPSLGSWGRFNENLEDRLSPVQKIQAAIHAQIRDSLESSLRSWKQLEETIEKKFSGSEKVQPENSEDYRSAEGSVDALLRDQLESSLGSWKEFDSDHDGDDESESGSDGNESSSPDASMADILPMLDELDPFLENEDQPADNLSRQSSAATMGRGEDLHDSDIHSDVESEQNEERDADHMKSDDDDDDEEEEEEGNQSSKEDTANSAITWTEDDEKNLMDLGTSELERNLRLESLIARRRSRRMMTERDLIDLNGMDLQFPVAPISTRRNNPFDFPHNSYADMGLPPIPGSAPSVMLKRPNPFDLPYDSSEEKPDLMEDSFQQEFRELVQKDSSPSKQREAFFRRNETFNVGSTFFDFGPRASRFRPYFVPERSDSDVMSYSSLQRQCSELSESKMSSVAETELTSIDGDREEGKLIGHGSFQEEEPSSEIEHASVLVEHGSQSSDSVHSLSDKEDESHDHAPTVLKRELGMPESSPTSASHASEIEQSAEITPGDKENSDDMGIRSGDVPLMSEAIERKHSVTSSSSSLLQEDLKVEDGGDCLLYREQREVSNVESADSQVRVSLETSVSNIDIMHPQEASIFSHATEVDETYANDPVYDSSPRSMRKKLSSSSISSYLQMEKPEVNIYPLSSVQKDLFEVTESNDCVEVTESDAVVQVEVRNDNKVIKEEISEGDNHGISDLQLSESGNTESSMLIELDANRNSKSSDNPLVEDTSVGDGVTQGEREQIPEPQDVAEVDHEEKKVGGESADEKPTTHQGRETVTLDDCVSSVLSDLSCLEVGSQEEAMEKDVDMHFQELSVNLIDLDENIDENLVTSLGERHLPHDSDVRDTCSDPGKQVAQEVSSLYGELQAVSEVNKIYKAVDILQVQDLCDNTLPDPLQCPESSSNPEQSRTLPNLDLADENCPQGIAEYLSPPHTLAELYSVSQVADNKIIYEATDIEEMDEELLSELDAVGDFSVLEIGQSLIQTNYMPGQVDGEPHSALATSFTQDTVTGEVTSVEHHEPEREATKPGCDSFEELNFASYAGRDVSIGFPVLEDQFVDAMDVAFVEVSGVQTSVVTELGSTKHDTPDTETEIRLAVRDSGTHASELVSCYSDTTLGVEEIDLLTVDSSMATTDLNLDADEAKVDLGISVGETEIFERPGDTYDEIVELRIDRSINEIYEMPAVQENISPADDEPEDQIQRGDLALFKSQPIDMDNEVIESLGVEASAASSVVFKDQVERDDAGELIALPLHHEIEDLPVWDIKALAPDSEDMMDRVGSHSKESLVDIVGSQTEESAVVEESAASFVAFSDHVERDDAGELITLPLRQDIQDLPMVVSTALAPDSIGMMDRVGSIDSEPPCKKEVVEDMHELDVRTSDDVEAASPAGFHCIKSESLQMNRTVDEMQEMTAVESSVATFDELGNQMECDSTPGSNSRLMDGDVEGKKESEVVKSAIADIVEPSDLISQAGSAESESWEIVGDAKEIQDDSSITPAVEHQDQTQKIGFQEPELSQLSEDIEEIQESAVFDASIPLAVESEDPKERELPDGEGYSASGSGIIQRELENSFVQDCVTEVSIVSAASHHTETNPQIEVFRAQAVQDNQPLSQPHSDIGPPETDFAGIDSVVSDLSSTSIESNESARGKSHSKSPSSSSSSSSSSLSYSDSEDN